MIIGFLGKGGSGKSTLATALAKYVHAEGNEVLAIDADHNMDLVWNLTDDTSLPYLGESIGDINEYAGIEKNASYKDVFYKDLSPKFSLSPADLFTSKYRKQIKPQFYLMASGPHTETILHGNKCSHSLSTALKVYLPFLVLKENEVVIVDEKASSDAAGTGVPTGFTISYIVVEATPHSVKAAQQIANTLEFYDAPYEFILNKVTNEIQQEFVFSKLPKNPIAIFSFSSEINTLDTSNLKKLTTKAKELEISSPNARKERSIKKFKSGKDFVDKHQLS